MGGKCQICGYDKCYQALEFHHINPEEKEFTISYNQNKSWKTMSKEIKKCTLLCSNCHRELHAGLIDESKLISPFDEEKAKEIEETIEKLKKHQISYCRYCGKEIPYSGSNSTRVCDECSKKQKTKIEKPDRETFKKEIRNNSFKSLARKYNISDNGIRTWCKQYNLPFHKKEIDSYSDEEWSKF